LSLWAFVSVLVKASYENVDEIDLKTLFCVDDLSLFSIGSFQEPDGQFFAQTPEKTSSSEEDEKKSKKKNVAF